VMGTGEQFIFLWGDTGHGKSHLLHACCSAAFNLAISSFYLDLSDSAATNPELFVGLENFDLVCLDNIDAPVKSEDWELAFFNFFNQHRDRKLRLILSSTSAPNAITFKLPDLLTRVNWGLSLKIQPLNDDNKIAALRHKAQQMGFDITPQVARFLLTHYGRDLTSLWLMLDKLDWASLAAKRKLTIPFLKEILERTD
jgi:DnaA-homolog protein